MILKVFFTNNTVGIYSGNEFFFNHNEIIIETNDTNTVLDKNDVKNYTVYTDSGQQIHTTYKPGRYHFEKNQQDV